MHINLANNSHLAPRPNRVAKRNIKNGLPTVAGPFLHTTQPTPPAHNNRWTCNVAK